MFRKINLEGGEGKGIWLKAGEGRQGREKEMTKEKEENEL
ncbi:hypothetical protein KNP414_06882 [Paenibacillus mucilaginosus KNP414]|uniref:Uncharacterized protein n=1 Tax=Paenibacillus mucilaginosus (strain KNP414) TaxID=1036673 RepID=F8FGM3_PAEMK|nr:hypothetical protein KNP414_06882 [Paenibacillus mucilaginosus KNP414]